MRRLFPRNMYIFLINSTLHVSTQTIYHTSIFMSSLSQVNCVLYIFIFCLYFIHSWRREKFLFTREPYRHPHHLLKPCRQPYHDREPDSKDHHHPTTPFPPRTGFVPANVRGGGGRYNPRSAEAV